MDKAERSALLRERLLAVRGYALPALPKATPKPKAVAKLPFRQCAFGILTGSRIMPAKFVTVPDPAPAIAVRIKRTARLSPLTAIAAKWRRVS